MQNNRGDPGVARLYTRRHIAFHNSAAQNQPHSVVFTRPTGLLSGHIGIHPVPDDAQLASESVTASDAACHGLLGAG